jgi:two-component system, LytTR family, response regulator
MVSCLIVDDESHAIEVLKKYINETPYLTLVGTTTDIFEASEILKKQHVDLLFLDIHMPKITGLQFLNLYVGDVKVILTTAYAEFALEGYEYDNVVDYLMKPINYQRFLKSTQKVVNILNKEDAGNKEKELVEDKNFIFVKTEHKGKIQKINFDDITYIEGLKNYVSINTNKGERIVTYIGIGELENNLPRKFFIRVHRSYIIAIRCIEAMDGNEILMKGTPRIPTAGKYKEEFLANFEKNILAQK